MTEETRTTSPEAPAGPSPTPREEGEPGAPVGTQEGAAPAEAEAERLRRECAELQDRHLRLQAEFDNFRKRQRREREEHGRQAKERILREFPAVVDNLERALQHGQEAGREKLLEGVQLVLRQLLETLARFGVEPLEAKGASFDPHLHEAMSRIDTSGEPPDGTVMEEYRKGYLLDGKVLRPALVGVAKAVPGEDGEGAG